MAAKFQTYKDEGGYYRWRYVAGNGRISATSGESFDSHGNARRAIADFIFSVREVTEPNGQTLQIEEADE